MEILRKLVNVAENDPRIGCVGPKIKDLDGNIVAPYIKRPTWWDLSIGIKNARMNELSIGSIGNGLQSVWLLHVA